MNACSMRAVSRYLAVFALFFAFLAIQPPGLSAQAVPEIDDVSYQYDDLGRLVKVVYSLENKEYNYSYDEAGNRTEHEVRAARFGIGLWKASAYEGNTLSFGVWRVGPSSQSLDVHYETHVCIPANETEGLCTVAGQATPGADLRRSPGLSPLVPAAMVGAAILTLQPSAETAQKGQR